MEEFIWFIKERHSIYRKRFLYRLPPPWTEDPLLQKYKFCNIYRELDAGSDWILQYCRKECKTDVEKLFSLIAFRSINNFKIFKPTGSLEFVRLTSNKKLFIGALKKIAKGGGVWNSPYDPVSVRKPYIESYANIIKGAQNVKVLKGALLQEGWKSFCDYLKENLEDIRYFTLFQIAVDSCLLGITKFDNNTIDYVGWGAIPALREMFIDSEGGDEEKLRYLTRLCNKMIQGFVAQPLTITNVEHCLCEFRKYKGKQASNRKRMFLFKPREDSYPDYSFHK